MVQLNDDQKKAVEFGTGPLIIIAGAGTGKTTVITERIKHLVLSGRAKAPEILALTFTQKAAFEMQERVDIAMPYGYIDMDISTFHAFCDKILRQVGINIGLPGYKLLTQANAVKFFKDNLFDFDLDYFLPLGNPNKFIGGILTHFSRLQDENISPDDYSVWTKKFKGGKEETLKWKELANAYKKYSDLKLKEGDVDFGDLLVYSIKLFKDRPNVLEEYRKRYKYILVDEFQDTNFAQNELVTLLAGKNGNITVVADDDQAVYKWRGASISNVLQFRKTFPKAKVISLTANYRSGQEILDRAYDLIQFNNPDRLEIKEGIDKKLVSHKKDFVSEIRFIHEKRSEDEAARVTSEIKMLADQGKEFRDIAILVRANSHADSFIRYFQRAGIAYQFLGPSKLFEEKEVALLVAYLKVLFDPDDSGALYKLLSSSEIGIDPREVALIGNFARRKNKSFYETCIELNKAGGLTDLIQKHLSQGTGKTAGEILYSFLEETKLLQKLLDPQSQEALKSAGNVAKFFEKLKAFESENGGSVAQVVDWITLQEDVGESPLSESTDWEAEDSVKILTVHSAKGLEFSVVFLVNLVTRRFPSDNRGEQIPIPDELVKEILPEGDAHMEEERRLFYVGMTRAKDKLYLTASDYYGEEKTKKRISPFVFEALGEDVVSSEKIKIEDKQLALLDYRPSSRPQPASKPQAHVDYLSYSQINTFQICPLHYKLSYILKVPTPPSSALSFGSSMHKTLQEFYLKVKALKSPKEKLLFDVLRASWEGEGYKSKKHEEKAFQKAQKILSAFLKGEFDKNNQPIALEQSFKIPIFDSKDRVVVGGKIDRVDETPHGIKIIDYKTGENVPSQKEADESLQLTIYALAAANIAEPPFGISPENVELSFYYLEKETWVKTKRTKIQLARAKKEILKIKNEIEKSDFICSNHFLCQRGCEYSSFCRANK